MNKFYRLVSMLALTSAAFAYTSCTDYSEDLDALNNRIDKLETGRIATAEDAIKKLEGALSDANSAIKTLQGQTGKLEEADKDLQSQITANSNELKTAKENITKLQGDLAAARTELNNKIDAAAAKSAADIAAVADDLKKTQGDLAKATADLQAAIEANSTAINNNANAIAQNTSDIEALNKKVEDLNKKIDALEQTLIAKINEVDQKLGKEISDLKTAYNAHVEEYKKTVQDVVALQAKANELENNLAALRKLHGEDVEKLNARADSLRDALNEHIDDYQYFLEHDFQDLFNMVGTIAGMVQDIELPAIKADIEKANEAIAKAQADATTALGNIESLKNALGIYAEAGKLESTIADLQQQDATLKDIADSLGRDIATNATNIAANTAAISVNATAIATINSTIENIQSDIEELQETKLNIADFSKHFTDELTKVLAKDGVITKAIADAIDALNAKIQKQITSINNDIANLKTDINNVKNDVLAFKAQVNGMIQSVTFVPEYTDGMASAYWVYVMNGQKETPVSEKVVVKASFQVYPKDLVKKVSSKNVTVNVATLATRAEAPAEAENVSIVTSTAGMFDLEFELPATYAHKNIAFSVNVNQGGSETELTDIASCYVQAKNIDVDLTNRYVFYNPTEKKVWVDQTYKEDWFDAPAHVDLFAGYTPYINEGTAENPVYSTIASVAAKYHLTEANVTPVYNNKAAVKYVAKDDKEIKNAADAHLTVTDADKVSVSVEMNKEASEMKKYVGENVTVTSDYKVKGVKVINIAAKYIVVKHTTTAELKKAAHREVAIDWTYKFAVEHSVKNEGGIFDKAGAYKLPIEVGETGIYQFSEHDPEKYEDIMTYNILEIMNKYGEDAVQNVYEGTVVDVVGGKGKKLAGNTMSAKFDPRSGEVANVVLVDVNGYGDNFTGKTYTIETVYEIDDYEDMKIYFQITLGQRPVTVKYDVVKDFGYKIEIPITSNDVNITLSGISAKALADAQIAQYFSGVTANVFAADLANGNHKHTAKVHDGIRSNSLEEGKAKMEPAGVDGNIHISKDYLVNSSYKYSFEDQIDAWYGIKYIYTANSIEFAESKYGIKTSNEYVVDGVALIDGRLEIEHPTGYNPHSDIYKLQTIDMMKYWDVTTTAKLPTSDELTVKYTVLNNGTTAVHPTFAVNSNTTKATVLNGTDNSGNAVLTMERNKYLLDWSKSNLNEVKVKAELYVGQIKVAESTITLKNVDPITLKPVSEMIVELRPTNTTVEVNLWEAVEVNGLLAPKYTDEEGNQLDINLVVPSCPNHFYWEKKGDHSGVTIVDWWFTYTDVFDAVAVYQIADYGFVNETPAVKIGDETVNYDVNKYKYDAQAGTLTFYNDNANLQKDVTFTVQFKLGKNYLNNNTAKYCNLSVRFTQAK